MTYMTSIRLRKYCYRATAKSHSNIHLKYNNKIVRMLTIMLIDIKT